MSGLGARWELKKAMKNDKKKYNIIILEWIENVTQARKVQLRFAMFE